MPDPTPSPATPLVQQPTAIGAAFLAFTNSAFAAGTLLEFWSLTAVQVAAIQLVLGNFFIVVTLLAVKSHTSTPAETADKVATALATPPPKV